MSVNSFFFSGEAHTSPEQKQGQKSPYVEFSVRQVVQAKGNYPEKETVLKFVVFGDLMAQARGIKRGDNVMVQGKIGSIQRGEFLNPTLQVVGLMVGGPASVQRQQAAATQLLQPDLSDPDNLPF